jgi:hypothetical protein
MFSALRSGWVSNGMAWSMKLDVIISVPENVIKASPTGKTTCDAHDDAHGDAHDDSKYQNA